MIVALHFMFWFLKPAHAVYIVFDLVDYAILLYGASLVARLLVSNTQLFQRIWPFAFTGLALPFYIAAWFWYSVLGHHGFWTF